MKIYTRKGDEGTTQSLSGTKYRKDDETIEANGLIDETIVAIQKAKIPFKNQPIEKQFNKIIEALYLLGAEVSNGKASGLTKYIDKGFVDKLEQKIDENTTTINTFQYFENQQVLEVEEARVRVRKLERYLTRMLRRDTIRPVIYQYLNRLSDFLFTMSVMLSVTLKREEA